MKNREFFQNLAPLTKHREQFMIHFDSKISWKIFQMKNLIYQFEDIKILIEDLTAVSIKS